MLEQIDAWTSPLFVATNPDHEFLKDDLLAYISNYQAEQTQAIASEIAVSAKHQLFESKLSFLEAEEPVVMETRRMLEELISTVATGVNAPF